MRYKRLVGTVLALSICLAPASSLAQQRDACPEPNDALQDACLLAEAPMSSFLGTPDDVDGYRVVVNDFGARLRAELAASPPNYRLTLVNWNGDVMATSAPGERGEVVEALLPLPASCFLLVDSRDGLVSGTAPYTIGRVVSYLDRPAPTLYMRDELGAGQPLKLNTSDFAADYTTDRGRFTVAMKLAGSDAAAEPPTASMEIGKGSISLADFILSVDAKLIAGFKGGYRVIFRRHPNIDFAYYLLVRPGERLVKFQKWEDNHYTVFSDWHLEDVVDPTGVNRNVVRCDGPEIVLYINGKEVARASDNPNRPGNFAIGAVTWGEPATASFDNFLVTVPRR